MTDINSNINLNIDTNEAIQSIKNLQRQISVFHQQMLRSGSAANEQISRNLQSNLMKNIDATGKFRTQIKTIQDETESFTQSLEKNQMSLGQYFRYAGGATKSFGKLFSKEFNTIEKVAIERVKTLQTQYIKLGRDANGALKAIAVRPLALDMDNLATKTAIAAQKQQLLNQLLKQGSTNLLNFGKNTQWAGRQLMVGFTIPLGIAATTAAKAYMDIEKASIKFRRVYGDLNTGADEATRMSEEVKRLAMEFTKYGVAVKDTMEMAATAAATGASGAALLAQIQQASKLAVLGQVDQQQALETTISLTNAFQIATEDLAGSISFLNAVENQTVTSIEDLTIAIPKAAPVVKQLGGDVKDLSFFLTAMKEGGINASEGANALKSGLASLINPTAKASEFLQGFGINISGIVEANKGDVKGLVVDFAQALDTLDPLNRARAIEQLFGKFQFARLSTLFQNVIAEGSQAQTVLSLAKATSEELAVLSERELKKVESSPVFKFQKAIEQIQAKLAPVGEAFLKAITPIVEQVGKILDGFNNMGDGAKQFAVIATTVIAGIGPIALMTFGLIANGVANLIKMFASIKNFFNKTGSSTADLGETTEYMTQAQLEAQAVAAALDETHAKLVQSFTLEAEAINKLVGEYEKAIAAQSRYNAGAKPTEGGTPPGGGAGPTTSSPTPTKPSGTEKKEDKRKSIPTTFSVSGGNFEKQTYSSSAMYAPGNTPGGFGLDTEWLKNSKDAPLSWAASLMGGMRKSTKSGGSLAAFEEKTTAKFGGIFDELFEIYKSGVDDAKDVVELGQQTYPALKAKLDEAVKSGAITLREAAHVNNALRTLVNPRASDRTEYTSAPRYEGGFDEAGNAVLKRAGATERAGKTSKNTISKLYDMLREKAGMGARPKEQTYAHLAASGSEGMVFQEPRIRTAVSDADQALAQGLSQTLAAGGKVGQGQVELGPEGLLQNVKQEMKNVSKELVPEAAQVGKNTGDGILNGAKETLDTNSPSRKMYEVGQDGAQGLINGARDGFLKPPPGSGIIPPGSQAKGVLPPPPSSIPGVAAPTYTAPQKGKMAGLFDKAKGMAGQAASKVGEVAKKAGSSLYQAADKAFSEHMTAVMEEEDRAREIRQAQFSNLLEEARLNDAEFAAAADKRDQLIKLAQSGKELSAEQQAELEQAYKVIDKKKRLLSAEIDAGNMQEAAVGGAGNQKVPYGQLSKSGRKDYWKSFGNKVGKGAMGLSAVAGVASMIPGPVGEAASSALPLLGTLSTLSNLIAGPVSASFVGVAAVIAAMITVMLKLNEAYSQARDKSMALTEATGASTKAIRGLAEFAGKVSAGEFMDKVRQDRAKITYAAPGKTTFGESFVASDSGKALVEQYKSLMKSGGAKEVTRDMASQLTTAVVSGALSADQAKSIAANIAYELGNMTVGLKVRAEIVELVGADGKAFEKNPVEVSAKLTEKSVQNMQDSFGMMNKNIYSNVLTNTEIGRTVTAGATIAAATAAGAMIGTAVGGPIGTLVGGGLAAIGSSIIALETMKEAAAKAGQLSGVAVADMNLLTQQQNELADALDAYYIKKIREAEVEGKITEAKRLQVEYDTEKNKQNKVLADATQKMLDLYDQAAEKDKVIQGMESSITNKFKDDVNASMYIEPIRQAMNTVGLNEKQKVQLNLAILSESMTPGEVSGLLTMMSKDSSLKDVTFDILTRFPGKTGAEAIGISQMFNNEALQKDFILAVQKANTPSEVDDLTRMALQVQSLGGVAEQSINTMLNYAITNKDAAKEVNRVLDALDTQEVTTVEQAFEIVPKLKVNPEAFNQEYFKTLKNTEQKELYISTITTVLNTVDNVTTDKSFQKWWAEEGSKYGKISDHSPIFWKNVYAEAMGQKVTEGVVDTTLAVNPETPAGGGGGAKEVSFLDAIVKRIRDVLKYTQQLTEGWAKSKKAIEDFAKTGMNVFDGLEMKLKRAGATDELTGAILGLSKEDYDKYKSRLMDAKGNLTDFAKTLIKVTNQLAFGDAIVQNDKIVLQAKTMSQAFSGAKNGMQSFIDKGIVSAADAYEILSDATLASAFAADKEGKSRKALINSYMMAKKAQWLMLSAEQKRQKYVEMYNANLEVIALQEEEINKKYDKRNEALDKIQAANDAIAKQNQAQLSLSEALSRGDLSGAVRAAKEMESLSATQAVEARRAAMEKARQDELGKITTDVNGVLMTRKDIEDQIKAANEATVLAKAAQLEKEIAIGKQAEANRSAILAWAASKDNPANGAIGGGTGGGPGGGPVVPPPPPPPTPVVLTPAQQAAAVQSSAIAAIRADDKNFDPKKVKGKTYDNPITTGIPDNSSIPETKKLFSLGQYVKLPKGVYMQTMVVKPNKIVELTFSSEPNAAKIKTKGNSVRLETDMAGNLPPYQRFASGGMVMPKYMSVGGQAVGTDTVPAMLTPGEFIVSQPAVEDFGINNLKAINNGTYGGNSVYNYSVNVNAGSNASADDIARAVMNKINEVDARRVRGNNF